MQRLDWRRIRMHYAARLAAARKQGLTQREIATAGGLTGQNAISKLLANDNQGPTVDTFVRAVQGLGLTLAGFFEEMEQQGSTHADRSLPAPPSAILAGLDPDAVDAIVTKHFTSLGRQLQRLAHDLGATGRQGRNNDRPVSAPGRRPRRRGRETA